MKIKISFRFKTLGQQLNVLENEEESLHTVFKGGKYATESERLR